MNPRTQIARYSLRDRRVVTWALVFFSLVGSAVAPSSHSAAQPTTSNSPTALAWTKAPLVPPTRASGPRASTCQVRRIDAWFQVRCPELATSAITQLGGSAKHVHLTLDPVADDGLPRAGDLVFRLERKDHRVFSFWSIGEGYDGPMTIIAAVILQVETQPDAPPVILLHDALNEPVKTAQGEQRKKQQASDPTATTQNPQPSSPGNEQ